MADATSKRAAAMSVFLSNEIFTFPEPFREVEDVPEQPFRLESTPSSLEVTSDSTTSEVAPFILQETEMECPPDAGLYWIRSMPNEAMPITDSATMTSITENGENRILFIIFYLRLR